MSKFKSEGGGVLSTARKDGKTVYYIRYGWRGRRPVEKVGLDLDRARGRIEARREALEDPTYIPPPIKRELEREAAAKAKEKPAPMFSDVLKVYRRECAPLRRDQQWQKDMLRIIGKEFGGLTIAEVDADRIEAWRDRLNEPRMEKDKNGQPVERRLSAQTVRSYVYFLSGIFKSCGKIAKGRALVTGNPVENIQLPKIAKGLKKALTLPQALAVTVAAQYDPALERWAWLVLYTGMRIQEAMRLCWGDVDLEAGEFAIHETKTGVPRVVAAGDELLSKLAAWHEGDDPHPDELVIGEEFEEVPTQRWRNVFEHAGIPWGRARDKFTTRNLRTTFCMLAFQNGARPEALVQQTGHSIATLFAYYAQASKEQREQAVNAMPKLEGAHLEAAVWKAVPQNHSIPSMHDVS